MTQRGVREHPEQLVRHDTGLFADAQASDTSIIVRRWRSALPPARRHGAGAGVRLSLAVWSSRGALVRASRVAPLDFSRPELMALARALAPAYLRVGGTEADDLYYDFAPRQPDAPLLAGYKLVPSPTVWDAEGPHG